MFDFTERTRYDAIVDSEWSAQLDGCFVPLVCCFEKWVHLVRRYPETLIPPAARQRVLGAALWTIIPLVATVVLHLVPRSNS